jgi:hypothetical protein
MPYLRFFLRIGTLSLLAGALTACSGGDAPIADQSGAGAQTASFVPQSSAVAASRTDALAQPLPEPLVALGGRRIAPDITSPIVNDSGSYANGPIILGTDTAAAGYGLEGITDGSGAGVYGHSGSGSVTSYGVYGFSPGGAGVYGYTNKTGSGVLGVSAKGNGVLGETSFPSGFVGPFQKAGVMGEDLSTDGGYWDAGVEGTTANGVGVFGSASGYGFGVEASATTDYGVFATATSGTAIYADAASGTGLIAQSGGYSIIGRNGSGTDTMSLDNEGNMIVLGNLTVDGTVTQGSSITPAISSPNRDAQIERVGGARLANGSAYVSIDSDFSKQLDSTKSYRVFLTPDGDSKGLYVTDKTAAGFSVRENQGGRSTLSFDYRIVGTPRAAALPSPVRVRLPRDPNRER